MIQQVLFVGLLFSWGLPFNIAVLKLKPTRHCWPYLYRIRQTIIMIWFSRWNAWLLPSIILFCFKPKNVSHTTASYNSILLFSRWCAHLHGRSGQLGGDALQHHAPHLHGPGSTRPLLPERLGHPHLHVSLWNLLNRSNQSSSSN